MRLSDLPKFEVLRSMTKLSFGSVLAQMIPFIFSPFISRLYTAEDFGLFASLLAMVNIVSVVINGRYELCVVLPKEDEKAGTLILANWLVGISFSFFVGIVLATFISEISTLLNIDLEFFDVILVFLTILMVSLWQPLNYFFIRKKAFGEIAINKVVQTTTLTAATLIFGWLAVKNGLMLGYFFGFTFLTGFSVYQARRLNWTIIRQGFDQVKETLVEYSSYTRYTAVPALMNSIAGQLGVYVFLFFYSNELTGYYSFAKQYVFVPMSIIGTSLSQVYFQRISEKFVNRLLIAKEIRYLFFVLLTLAVFAIFFIKLFGTSLFVLIFGEEWHQAGLFAEILIFYFAVQFIVSPLSNILYAVNEVKLAAIFPIVYLVSMVLLFFLPKMDIGAFLHFYLLAETVPYMLYLSLIFYAVYKYENKITN